MDRIPVATAERVKANLVLANDPDADRLAVMVRDGAGEAADLCSPATRWA